MHDPDPDRLRPGALCIPPHMHAAVFAGADAELPRVWSPQVSTHLAPCPPIAPSSRSMCADRPSAAERRLLSERSRRGRTAEGPRPSCVPVTAWDEKAVLARRDALSTSDDALVHDCEKGAYTPPRRPWARRLVLCLALLVAVPLTWLVIANELVLLDELDELDGFSLGSHAHPGDMPQLPIEWWRRCTALLPVPAGTYPSRLTKLSAALGDAAWVAEPGPSAEYFFGAFGKSAWKPSERPLLLAVKAEKVFILTPAFEERRARMIPLPDEIKDRVTWLPWAENEDAYAVLAAALRAPLVLDGGVRTFIADGLAHHAPRAIGGIGQAVASIREIKDGREIGLLRCANEATLLAIRRTRLRMRIGIHESAAREILYQEMKSAGLSDYSALVLFGPDAALPHGSGTDRVLAKNEFALIDAGGRWGGYMADVTRTFFLPDSEIPDAHRWVWEIVRAAQRAPANLLRLIEPGEEAFFSWLDDRARETIKKGMAALGVPPARGVDYTVFTHRLGHGTGLEGHEGPYVVQGPLGERQVRPGQVFTLEPGVYVPADSTVGEERIRGLGVRIEDTVVVVERGGRLAVEWLTGPVEKWGDV